jgi:flagellar assembly protein FliH
LVESVAKTSAATIAAGNVEAFQYPASSGAAPVPKWQGWIEALGGESTQAWQNPKGEDTGDAEGAAKTAEENTRAFEAGRQRGREEGRALEREASSAAKRAEEDRHVREYTKLVTDFTAASEGYLNAMEREVVRLALAVAARILRREAQMDPLLLAGAVRVALGQLAANSELRLRVPAAQADLWSEAVALVPNRAVKPVVVADEKMRLGDCIIESQVGSVDLGVRSQLGEIERGFFDRADAGARLGDGTPETAKCEAEAQ